MDAPTQEAAPTAGHNNPPQTLAERLKLDHAPLFDKVEELAQRANGAPKEFGDDTHIASAATLTADCRKLLEQMNDAHKKEKAPIIQDGNTIDETFGSALAKPPTGPRGRLRKIMDAMQSRANALAEKRRREAEAKRREEEQRLRDEAAAAARAAEEAAAAGRTEDALADLQDVQAAQDQLEEVTQEPAKPTPIVTDSGARATDKTEWAFEVTDWTAIDLNVIRPYLKAAVVEKAIGDYLKRAEGTAKMIGVRFFQRAVTNFRR